VACIRFRRNTTASPGVGTDAVLPSISRKGNLLAYQQGYGKGNIWRVSLKDENTAWADLRW